MPADNQPTDSANPVFMNTPTNNSQYELSWRSKFPQLPVLILSMVQLVFIVLIFILEIASIAVLSYRVTAVGIWSTVPFLSACILTFMLVHKKDGSRMWATIVLIAQLILLLFTFILIGITGNYVQTYAYGYNILNIYSSSGTSIDSYGQSYITKYRIVQAQLAFGILLMFSGFVYIGIYIYVTIAAIWQPFHTFDTNNIFRK